MGGSRHCFLTYYFLNTDDNLSLWVRRSLIVMFNSNKLAATRLKTRLPGLKTTATTVRIYNSLSQEVESKLVTVKILRSESVSLELCILFKSRVLHICR